MALDNLSKGNMERKLKFIYDLIEFGIDTENNLIFFAALHRLCREENHHQIRLAIVERMIHKTNQEEFVNLLDVVINEANRGYFINDNGTQPVSPETMRRQKVHAEFIL